MDFAIFGRAMPGGPFRRQPPGRHRRDRGRADGMRGAGRGRYIEGLREARPHRAPLTGRSRTSLRALLEPRLAAALASSAPQPGASLHNQTTAMPEADITPSISLRPGLE